MSTVADVGKNVAAGLLAAAIGAVAIVLLQRWSTARKWLLLRPIRKASATDDGRARADALGDAAHHGRRLVDWGERDNRCDATRAANCRSFGRRRLCDVAARLTRPGADGLISRPGLQGRGTKRRDKGDRGDTRHFDRSNEVSNSTTSLCGKGQLLIVGNRGDRRGRSTRFARLPKQDRPRRSRLASRRLPGAPRSDGKSYDECHSPNCDAAAAVLKPGDYDARVLTLDACGYTENSSTGELSFVLETRESCYAATEQGSEPWGCKHLPKPGSDGVGLRFDGIARRKRVGERLCLVTSYVTVLTGDRQLVLCRRSKDVRTGRRVVSASAGGVCEPGDRYRGDRNSLGWPDVIASGHADRARNSASMSSVSNFRPAAPFIVNQPARSRTQPTHSRRTKGSWS